MSDGHNRDFLANPTDYARNKIILVPDHSAGGFWSAVQNGPFDLREVRNTGFDGTVLVLTHMNRRGKGEAWRTRSIPGIWIPYADDRLEQRRVTATTDRYCVFTSKLGGCALGMSDLNNPTATFTHDATNHQARNLQGAALTLFPNSYDPHDDGINVTAFFWWDAKAGQWNLGRSATYNAHFRTQDIGQDKYPAKLPERLIGGPARDEARRGLRRRSEQEHRGLHRPPGPPIRLVRVIVHGDTQDSAPLDLRGRLGKCRRPVPWSTPDSRRA